MLLFRKLRKKFGTHDEMIYFGHDQISIIMENKGRLLSRRKVIQGVPYLVIDENIGHIMTIFSKMDQ